MITRYDITPSLDFSAIFKMIQTMLVLIDSITMSIIKSVVITRREVRRQYNCQPLSHLLHQPADHKDDHNQVIKKWSVIDCGHQLPLKTSRINTSTTIPIERQQLRSLSLPPVRDDQDQLKILQTAIDKSPRSVWDPRRWEISKRLSPPFDKIHTANATITSLLNSTRMTMTTPRKGSTIKPKNTKVASSTLSILSTETRRLSPHTAV